jgi:RNA-directed DNA polymerase
LILGPIFEADFLDCSYGFRPHRDAHQALEQIRKYIKEGYRAIYDADLKGYFDSIPHDKLMAGLRTRITDRTVLRLIRMWLHAPILEEDKGMRRMSHPKAGTPQGGVISPLLANAYLHWFDRAFHGEGGPARWAKAKLVRYADDFVVLARYQGPKLVKWIETTLEARLGLTINREKTSTVDLNAGDTLDFLGFTFRYDPDLKGQGHKYLNCFPSRKAQAREREKLRAMTNKSVCFKPIPALICLINRHLTGWANYFKFGYPRKVFREFNWFVRSRMAAHLRRRSQRPFRPPKGVTLYAHLKTLCLVYL